MDIAIIGPGAMGTFLAGLLAKENKVTLFGRREHQDINKVKIKGKTELEIGVDYATDSSKLADVELVVICTKAFDTEEAIKSVVDHIPSKCDILSLQNGLKNEEIIEDNVGEDRTIGGITSHGVTYLGIGKVRHAGEGETVIGAYPHGDRAEIKKVASTLSEAGMRTKISDNILGHIWKKVIINAGINPITALLRIKNGFLLEDKDLLALLKEAVKEGTEVAERYTDLPLEDLFEKTKRVAESTAENRSSMLQDILNNKRTEIDQINGAVVEKADECGISVPVNKSLYRLVRGMESTYL
ncbi:MAG: ketopantoate reductase family protein [Candidatus Natronoplasma sp.]